MTNIAPVPYEEASGWLTGGEAPPKSKINIAQWRMSMDAWMLR